MSYALPEHVIVRSIDRETVLLDLEAAQYYGLCDVGTAILDAALQGCDQAGVVDRLEARYRVPREEFERDVSALLVELTSAGLLQQTQA